MHRSNAGAAKFPSSVIKKKWRRKTMVSKGKKSTEPKDNALAGTPRMGWFCSYTPLEILHAAGLFPYRIAGHSDPNSSRRKNECFSAHFQISESVSLKRKKLIFSVYAGIFLFVSLQYQYAIRKHKRGL